MEAHVDRRSRARSGHGGVPGGTPATAAREKLNNDTLINFLSHIVFTDVM